MPELTPSPKKREAALIGALALYVVVAVILLTPIGGALSGQDQPDQPGPSPPALGAGADPTAEAQPPDPMLNSSQRLRARGIVGADRFFAAALRGAPHSIAEFEPWTTYGGRRLLGAAFVVAVDPPIDLRGVKLPQALYDQTERANPPYQEVVNRVSATRVSELLVLVDLKRGRVVSIDPGFGAQQVTSTPPPGFKRTVPLPREGGR